MQKEISDHLNNQNNRQKLYRLKRRIIDTTGKENNFFK